MKKLILLLGSLFLFSGCSKVYDHDYWEKVYPALPVSSIIEVESIPSCGNIKETTMSTIYGCTYRIDNPGYAIIYIDKHLGKKEKECVKTHEENHAAGFIRTNNPTEFLHCGDGSLMRV